MANRIRVEDLTPGERQGLQAQGREVPAAGFVDIAAPSSPVMVDPKAEQRAKIARELKSVAEPAKPAPEPVAAQAEPAAPPKPVKEENGAEPDKSVPAVRECPHCGWELARPDPAEPTKTEIADFLRSVMGGEVFSQEYTMYGGGVRVTLRTRTEAEQEGVREAIRFLIRSTRVDNEHDLLGRSRRIHLALAIARLDLGENTMAFPALDQILGDQIHLGDAVLKVVDERLARIPTQLLVALYRVFDIFSSKVDTMTARAQDPGFWTGSAPTP